MVSAAALSKFCKFLSTPSARRATAELSESYTAKVFLSTPSARRATVTPPADRDEGWKFLSTPSARRATWPVQGCARQAGISIHALREEGDSPCVAWEQGHSISIHALREEGDESSKKADSGKGISIHALREEGDPRCCRSGYSPTRFLSTPSARRATSLWHISMALPFSFLSTPSARRATYTACVWLCQFDISIHALREEGDLPQWSLNRLFIFYFYPRPPRGGRRLFPVTSLYFFSFLSTPSARRATTR